MPKIQYPLAIIAPFKPMANQAHQTRTVDSVLTLNIPIGCETVLVQAVSQNIRYTVNGTNPAADRGFVLIAGNDPIAIGVDLQTTVLKFIEESSGAYLELEFGE